MANFVLNFPSYLLRGNDPMIFTLNPVQESGANWGREGYVASPRNRRGKSITTTTAAPAGKTVRRRGAGRPRKHNNEQLVTNG